MPPRGWLLVVLLAAAGLGMPSAAADLPGAALPLARLRWSQWRRTLLAGVGIRGASSGDRLPDELGLDLLEPAWNATLDELAPDAHVIMEYYASWCPHCRHFKPQYDAVARAVARHNAAPATQPADRIHVHRVDCAIEVALCGAYAINGYPTIRLSTAGALRRRDNNATKAFSAGVLGFTHNAKGVLRWVEKELAIKMMLEDADLKPAGEKAGGVKAMKAASMTAAEAAAVKWDVADVEEATRQLWDQIVNGAATKGADQRAALVDLLRLWAEAHASARCRAGAAAALEKLPGIWPEAGEGGSSQDLAQLGGMCGPPKPEGVPVWGACAGSTPNGRGFTCGLWLWLHTSAARVPDGTEGAQLFQAGVRAFAFHFFGCEHCAKHFQGFLGRSEFTSLSSQHQVALWVWKTHNEVNERLAKEEQEEGGGDAAHPKLQWPPAGACAACRGRQGSTSGAADWDEEEVARFLTTHYGSSLRDAGPAVKARDPDAVGKLRIARGESAARHGGALDEAGAAAARGNGLAYASILACIVIVAYFAWSRTAGQGRRPRAIMGVSWPAQAPALRNGANGNGRGAGRLGGTWR